MQVMWLKTELVDIQVLLDTIIQQHILSSQAHIFCRNQGKPLMMENTVHYSPQNQRTSLRRSNIPSLPSPVGRRSDIIFLDAKYTMPSLDLQQPDDFILVAPRELLSNSNQKLPLLFLGSPSGVTEVATTGNRVFAAAVITPLDLTKNVYSIDRLGDVSHFRRKENLFIPVDTGVEMELGGSRQGSRRHSHPPLPGIWLKPRASRGCSEDWTFDALSTPKN